MYYYVVMFVNIGVFLKILILKFSSFLLENEQTHQLTYATDFDGEQQKMNVFISERQQISFLHYFILVFQKYQRLQFTY